MSSVFAPNLICCVLRYDNLLMTKPTLLCPCHPVGPERSSFVKIRDAHADIPKYIDQLAVPLYWNLIRATCHPLPPLVSLDSRVVSIAAKIATLTVRSSKSSVSLHICSDSSNMRQGTFASTLFSALESGKTTPLLARCLLPGMRSHSHPFLWA
jgi:hypothetical protein